MKTVDNAADQTAELDDSFNGIGPGPNSKCHNFRVTVVHTTKNPTIAALRTAASLAAGLGAELALLSLEEVPVPLPLDNLPVPVELLEQRLYDMVCDAGIRESEVLIQLVFCRNKYASLRQTLAPRSLVVVGETNHSRSRRNRKLDKFLRNLGHDVVLVTSPRPKHFWCDWNWEAFLTRAFMNLGARRVEI